MSGIEVVDVAHVIQLAVAPVILLSPASTSCSTC
jgi:hypothetical protein